MENEKFVAYEYKQISVKSDSAELYTDCLQNFGWKLVEEQKNGYGGHPFGPAAMVSEFAGAVSQASAENASDVDLVTLKFKRDRKLPNKLELYKLEKKCEEALEAIEKLKKKNSAYSIGISIGAGIIGTAFLGLGVYYFIAANVLVGIGCSAIGFFGWAAGFFANLKLSRKKAEQSESMIHHHLEVAYGACERAHEMLV